MAGNVAIRFSVENEEVVRQALERLGTAGEKAMRQLDAASRQPTSGLKGLSAIVEDLKGRASGFAFSLGPIGTGLVALGPVGLAVATVLGGVAAAFSKASEVIDRFAEKARQTKEAAETAGVTITQFKALAEAGAAVGLQSEKTSQFVDRLTISFEELRRGRGPLFEALLRIDEGLVREAASAKSTAEAIDVVSRAYDRLGDAGKRNALATAIGGRGSAGAGQIFDALRQKGGLASTETNEQLENTITRLAEAKTRLEQIQTRSANLWGEAFGPGIIAQQERAAEAQERIAKAILSIREWWNAPETFRRPRGMPQSASPAAPELDLSRVGGKAGAVAAPIPGAVPLETELGLLQRRNAILGDAITRQEQFRQKELEIRTALGGTDEVRQRALNALTLAQERANVATRTGLGIASEEELLKQKLIEIERLYAEKVIRTAEEKAAAERLVRREVKETTEAITVRNSLTPALTKLSSDAGNLQRNLDEGLAGALRGSTADLIDMAKGAKSASQALGDMIGRMADAVAQALLMKSVVGPLSNAISGGLGSFFGGGGGAAGVDASGSFVASASGNAFSRGELMRFARGGVVNRPTIFPMARGGIGLMGEAGAEAIMPLRQLGNGRLGVEASGAPQVNVEFNVINNHPNARVSTRQEDDGRGGRKMIAIIEEVVAQAFSRPGSPALKALRQSQFVLR